MAVSEPKGSARRFLSVNGKTDAGSGAEDVVHAEVHRPRADAAAPRAAARPRDRLGRGGDGGLGRALPARVARVRGDRAGHVGGRALLRRAQRAAEGRPALPDRVPRRAQPPAALARRLRRDRLRALEPVDLRRLEPLHARVPRGGASPARPGRGLRPVVPLLQPRPGRREGRDQDLPLRLSARLAVARAAGGAGGRDQEPRGRPPARGQPRAAAARLGPARAGLRRPGPRRRPAGDARRLGPRGARRHLGDGARGDGALGRGPGGVSLAGPPSTPTTSRTSSSWPRGATSCGRPRPRGRRPRSTPRWARRRATCGPAFGSARGRAGGRGASCATWPSATSPRSSPSAPRGPWRRRWPRTRATRGPGRRSAASPSTGATTGARRRRTGRSSASRPRTWPRGCGSAPCSPGSSGGARRARRSRRARALDPKAPVDAELLAFLDRQAARPGAPAR